MSIVRRIFVISFVCLGLVAAACASAAPQGKLTGDQIRGTIVGNTLAGQIAGGAYSEYYQADGVIKGKDYTGLWTIDGDTLCVEYEGMDKACYTLELDGSKVQWLNPDGSLAGDGALTRGNSNNY